MPEYSSILTEVYGRVGLVRLNRPGVMNALNATLMSELMDSLAAFDRDDGIGALVITGNERVFTAGADIKEMANASPIDMFLKDHVSLYDRMRGIKKPVIRSEYQAVNYTIMIFHNQLLLP